MKTASRTRIRRKYTRVCRNGDTYRTDFVSGNQTFTVAYNQSRQGAEFFRDMLVQALRNVVAEEMNR